MNLVQQIIREYLDRRHKAASSEAEREAVARIDSLNALPLEEFHTLPEEDQRLAEDLWAARVVEENVRRQDERRQRVRRERALAFSN
ncbi:MAG: hypothetical protein WDN24_05010 [Sphingomonas sp.]